MRRRLAPATCSDLRQSVERGQQRLAYLFAVEDHAGVIAEARRCRAAMHLCAEFAEQDADRHIGCAAHVIVMETRAHVALATRADQPLEALLHIDAGLRDLLDYFAARANVRAYDRAREVRALEHLRDRMLEEIFPGPHAELRRALAEALREERYEDAARLRDHLRARRLRPQ
ncbi:MAG: UvrB/UvrC motif-containing protein [Phycisphaerales bacterium]|nr:UvrB/UvrC motif-containing protein [Phycisphaerales bacterium]